MTKDELNRFSELGVATVYEASGREGLIDIPLIQLIPGSRAAGPARTALCGQDDNLMVHAVIEQIQPGEVLVLSMPEPGPVALVGELLATQVKVRGAAAILIDAAVRDVEELVKLDLPIWARFVRVKGATKSKVGEINATLSVGGTRISPGDIVILDADGAVCVGQEKAAKFEGGRTVFAQIGLRKNVDQKHVRPGLRKTLESNRRKE
jgi:4-hydroxy-4-methyl-2-oxoglutarate aldolase